MVNLPDLSFIKFPKTPPYRRKALDTPAATMLYSQYHIGGTIMYVRVGKTVYQESDIEAMSADQIMNVQQYIRDQQLFTSNKIDAAKVSMAEDAPIEDREYFALKKKLRILNNVALYLAGIRKKRNIEQSKGEDKLLIAILREWVGEDRFLEACAIVNNKGRGSK